MAQVITSVACQSLTSIASGAYFNFYRTNFNMPVPHVYYSEPGTFVQNSGPCTLGGTNTSWDLAGWTPGLEIVVASSCANWDATMSSESGCTMTQQWVHPTTGVIGTQTTAPFTVPALAGSEWYGYWLGYNIGLAPWEVNTSGTYKIRTYVTAGAHAISQTDHNIAFTNVPSTTQLDASKRGYVWVDGNYLGLVGYNQWAHRILGTLHDTSPASGDKGHIWVETSDNKLHWVREDGDEVKLPWFKAEFASYFSNSSNDATAPGAGYAGYAWIDQEYGHTHLAYIGYDGKKYLCGAGDNPY